MSGDDTTTTETTTDDQTDLQATEVDTDTDDTGDEGKGETRSQRRHQRDRDRADAAEARAAELAGRVQAFQRKEIERIAGEVLAQGGDLLEFGKLKLEDLVDPETGELLDEDEIRGMAAALIDQRPGLAQGARLPARGSHVDWGHSRAGEMIGGEGPSWDDALEVRRL